MPPLLTRLASQVSAVIPPGREGLVWWLTVIAALGVTSVLPLMPLYAKEQGADLNAIGLMAAAYLVTNLLCLYGAGRLSDWIGRRPLMGAGLLTYALCTVGFWVWPTPTGFITLRAIEGIAAACFLPAALAYVADSFPASERGLRISQLAVAENLGLLLGPAFGGLIADFWGMGALFAVLTIGCGLGAVLVAYLPVRRVEVDPDEPPAPPSHWQDVRRVLLTGVSARAFAVGVALGLYMTVWPIFMAEMGATGFQVAMSWTLFAVPAVLLGPFPGRVIDRSGPALSVILGGFASAGFVIAYAYAPSVPVLLLLCMLEGIGFAFAYPGNNTLTVQTSPEDMRGRVIGLVTAIKTLGTLVGALACPALYLLNQELAFEMTSLALFAGSVALAIAVRLESRWSPPKDPGVPPHDPEPTSFPAPVA